MVANTPKRYKTHQNMSLGTNGVDQVGSLRKILTRLHGTNFCTSSARFAVSFVRQQKGPECTQIVRNAPNHKLRVQWRGSGAFVAKNIPTRLCGTDFCNSSARFILSFVRQPNGPKCTQIVRNAPSFLVYGPMGWIGCIRCERFQRDFVARTFALVRPILHRVS